MLIFFRGENLSLVSTWASLDAQNPHTWKEIPLPKPFFKGPLECTAKLTALPRFLAGSHAALVGSRLLRANVVGCWLGSMAGDQTPQLKTEGVNGISPQKEGGLGFKMKTNYDFVSIFVVICKWSETPQAIFMWVYIPSWKTSLSESQWWDESVLDTNKWPLLSAKTHPGGAKVDIHHPSCFLDF